MKKAIKIPVLVTDVSYNLPFFIRVYYHFRARLKDGSTGKD
jgi:hypothetical protein